MLIASGDVLCDGSVTGGVFSGIRPGQGGERHKNKKPRQKPRKKLQSPLTNGKMYAKMIFHTVGVCRQGILIQHGHLTTEYGGCQEISL